MAKTNPLFIDSTRIHGDRIGTQVELNNIVLYDDEKISITVIGQTGIPVHTQLEAVDEKSFGARIWLKHMEKISYQFVVENGDRRVLHTSIKQARALHAIVEEWEPTMEETVALIEVKKEEVPIPKGWVSEAARAAESLVEKWDL